MNEIDYKPDFEIADHYIKFSAELLRLSLLGISAFAGLIIHSKMNPAYLGFSVEATLFVSIIFFAITAGLCLFHRFYATDFKSYHIAFLRNGRNEEKIGRLKTLKRAELSLIILEYTFAIAVIIFAFAIYQFIF